LSNLSAEIKVELKSCKRRRELIIKKQRFVYLDWIGMVSLFSLFFYSKCWANLPKSQYESRPAAA
jgi:hypothetical protein